MPAPETSPSQKRAALVQHGFFRALPDSVLERLLAHARTASVPAGRTIFRKGDAGLGLLAVLSGIVKISAPSDEGKEVLLNLIGPNEVFGEIALLDGGQRTADACALTDCRLLCLDRRDFLPILAEEPVLATRLLEVLCRRLRQTSQQVEDMSFGELPTRLARVLLRFADIQATGQAAQPTISITQRELGQAIGLSRESTNRYLREWAVAGKIALRKGSITLLKPSEIRALAGSGAGHP
jgi:CRP-like cAMP-binding protein